LFQNTQRSLTESGEYQISEIGFEALHYLPLN